MYCTYCIYSLILREMKYLISILVCVCVGVWVCVYVCVKSLSLLFLLRYRITRLLTYFFQYSVPTRGRGAPQIHGNYCKTQFFWPHCSGRCGRDFVHSPRHFTIFSRSTAPTSTLDRSMLPNFINLDCMELMAFSWQFFNSVQ